MGEILLDWLEEGKQTDPLLAQKLNQVIDGGQSFLWEHILEKKTSTVKDTDIYIMYIFCKRWSKDSLIPWYGLKEAKFYNYCRLFLLSHSSIAFAGFHLQCLLVQVSDKTGPATNQSKKWESDMNLRHGRPLFVYEDIHAWFLSNGMQENLDPIFSLQRMSTKSPYQNHHCNQ